MAKAFETCHAGGLQRGPAALTALKPLRVSIHIERSATNGTVLKRTISTDEVAFIKKMIQRRHILIHNRGIVDDEYLDLSEDTSFALGERIRIRSTVAKRFLERVRDMGLNLIDNVEGNFQW